MACPYFSSSTRRRPSDLLWLSEANDRLNGVAQAGYNAIQKEDQETYGSYLKLEPILNAQVLLSADGGKLTPVHDEHLFIVTHQTFELWFKQILYELDSVREIFATEYLEERNQLTVISRLHRVAEILKHLCNQFPLLETMTPQEFLEMRPFLGNSSGFQSLQFRMLEIRLGMKEDLRVLYNKKHFLDVFFGDDRKTLEKAMQEKSLFDVVNDWLERTPGLKEDGFNFFSKFKASVTGMLRQERAVAEDCGNPDEVEILLQNVTKREEVFNSLFDEEIHNNLMKKGQRRFTHKAMQGALMVYLYRDEPRCHLPFQLFQHLMEIDSQMTKFRYNHTCMVQRMIGGKIGTGGSSGYLYLRSTCSDRYKVFLDLLNLSSFLVTRDRIPPLTSKIKRSLSIPDWIEEGKLHTSNKITPPDSDDDSGIISSFTKSLRRFSKASLGTAEKSIEPVKEESSEDYDEHSTVFSL